MNIYMPTIKSMIEKFKDINEYKYNYIEEFLLGSESYSFVMQEEIIRILDRNVIKTSKKETLNSDISIAMNESMNKIKRFEGRVSCKKIYNELVLMLNTDYGFNIDISSLNAKIIGTSQERCVYLLRQTEQGFKLILKCYYLINPLGNKNLRRYGIC